MIRNALLVFCVGVLAFSSPAAQLCPAQVANWPVVVFDMDTARHRPATFGSDKQPVGTVRVVPGKFGDACRLSFVQRMLRFAVDQIRRMTAGRSEVLLVTTCPAISRWDTMEELAEAVRVVAAKKRTGLADVSAAFHQAGAEPAARPSRYCRDKVHLGPAGHELAAKTMFRAIAETSQATDKLNAKTNQGRTQFVSVVSAGNEAARHPVPKGHPRLLGSRDRLHRLARERADAYQRVVRVARRGTADAHSRMMSMALVSAIEQDRPLGRQAIDMAQKTVDGPIKKGHVPFAHDLARCAIVYDLCHEYWTPEARVRFHQYVNKTVDANIRSESHVFHNGWYG